MNFTGQSPLLVSCKQHRESQVFAQIYPFHPTFGQNSISFRPNLPFLHPHLGENRNLSVDSQTSVCRHLTKKRVYQNSEGQASCQAFSILTHPYDRANTVHAYFRKGGFTTCAFSLRPRLSRQMVVPGLANSALTYPNPIPILRVGDMVPEVTWPMTLPSVSVNA